MKNTKDTLVSNEWIFTTEELAHVERRTLINQGWLVSLIGYDTERNMYVFDVYAHSTTKLTKEY